MSIATLSVDLLLNIGQYTRNAAQAVQASNRLTAGINSSLNQLKGVAAGLAGALSVDFLLGATKGAFDYADAIVDLSNQTGAATKTIQEFRYAAQLSGSSVENADAALGKFTKNMGESLSGAKAQQQMFKDLGVTSTDYDTALTQTIAGIGKLKTTQEQAAATAQVFGKSAADLVPLMASGKAGYDGLAAAAQSLGVVLEDQVLQNAGQVNDKIDQMTMIVTAQFANTIIQNADAFASLAGSMMSAAGAASQFFASMANRGNIDILNSPNLTNFASWVRGSNGDATRADATKGLMGNKEGRQMLYTRNVDRQNAIRARLNGTVRGTMNDPAADRAELIRLERERKGIVAAHVRARQPAPAHPPVTGGTMPTAALAEKPKPDKKAAAPKISDYEKEVAALKFEADQLTRTALQRETYNALKSAGVKLDTEEGHVIAGLVVANDNLSKSRDLTDYFRDQQHEIEQLGRSAREQAIYNQAHAMGIDVQSQLGRTLATNVGHYYDLRAAKEAADSKAKDDDAFNSTKADEYYTKQDGLLQQRKDFAANLGEIGRAGFEDWMTGVSDFGDAMANTLKDVSNTFLSDFLDGTLKIIASKLTEVFASVGKSSGGGLLGKILGVGTNLLAGSLGGPTGLSAGLTSVTSIGSTNAAATLASIPSISLSGARQAGGAVNDNHAYLTGEKGPEVFVPGGSGSIVSNAKLRGMFGGGGNMTINSTVTGVNDPAQVRALAGQTIAQATPMMLRMSSDNTMSRSRRPRLS